jgi:hypothetical protein
MSVCTYLCKVLNLYWCNINEIRLIFNLEKVPNSWEVSRTKVCKSKKSSSNLNQVVHWGVKKLKTKTKVPFKIKNQTTLG